MTKTSSTIGLMPADGLFDTVTGLPVHPLVAHAGVVLLPLSALGLIAIFAVTRWRDRFGPLTLLGMWAGVAAAFVAKESGESLAARVGEPQQHAAWGELLPLLALLSALIASIWFYLHRKSGTVVEAQSAGLHGPVTMAVGVTAVALALGTLGLTTAVGHSGAESVWADKIAPYEAEPGGEESPAPSASPTEDVWRFTMADVRQHDTPADCWSVVDGKVYDLTAWIGEHEGGAAVIEAMCGMDATGMFNGQHKGEREPAEELAAFELGSLTTESASPSVDVITLAEVKQHNSATDCWSAVAGKVYDLTNWIAKHPGGEGVIEGMCGLDATNAFNGQHEGQQVAISALAPYQIGTLG